MIQRTKSAFNHVPQQSAESHQFCIVVRLRLSEVANTVAKPRLANVFSN